MKEEFLDSPLLLSPVKIYNYTQLIASLKKKQQKLSKYRISIQPTSLRDFLRPKYSGFNVNDVVDGFLHNKLRCRQKEYEKTANKSFLLDLKKHMKELRRENDFFIVGSTKVCGKVGDLEAVFDKDPMSAELQEQIVGLTHEGVERKHGYFSDPMLLDVYMFLNSLKPSEDFEQEIEFLGAEYVKYMERFLKENADKIRTPLRRIEDKVTAFVKLRYNRNEYNLEMYEGRYLFAELYTLLRCGLTGSVEELLDHFHIFFEHISYKFKTQFRGWLATRSRPTVPIKVGASDDLFKVFLLGLQDGLNKRADGYVIGSIEDFIWIQLMGLKECGSVAGVLELFKNYRSPKGLLLAYIMTKNYDKAMEQVFKGDFPIVPSYFIMRSLCPRCSNRKVFTDFVFLAAARFSSTQRKVELLDTLRYSVGNYYEVVPEMIVKVGLYDVLGIEDGTCVYLDRRISNRVIEILQGRNEKKKLIKLYYLIDDESLVIDLINETITEAILTDTSIDEYLEIIEYYEKREDMRQIRTMSMLKSFYVFKKNPGLSSLRATPLFDLDLDLRGFKYVIEKIFKPACDVVERTGDAEMAKVLFRLCGVLELNEEVSRYVSRHLVLLV